MNSFEHSARELCLLALVTGLQLFVSSPGECLSLEIKGQSAFTVWEGNNSEINFFIYNMSREEEITLYVSKGGLHNKVDRSCKLVLTQTTCIRFSGLCQCSPRPSEGGLQFVFKRKFQAQDAGEWEFDVWNTNITRTVNISVKQTVNNTVKVEVTSGIPLRRDAPETTKPTSFKGLTENNKNLPRWSDCFSNWMSCNTGCFINTYPFEVRR